MTEYILIMGDYFILNDDTICLGILLVCLVIYFRQYGEWNLYIFLALKIFVVLKTGLKG